MAESVVLSQLCMVCRSQVPKYECPRCGTKTCSAPCVKQHKKRAQCNGQRDPAAYIKKSQLATPRGFDHDYNYLTGLERAIDRADKDAEHRGGDDFIGDRRLKKRVEELGIRWRRAPKGMSRQKESLTRWRHKQDCMRWTVEWIFPDGSRKVDGVLETFTLRAVYKELQSTYTINKRKQEKVANKLSQVELQRTSKRRKSGASQPATYVPVHDDELQAVLEANAKHGVGEQSDVTATALANAEGERAGLQPDVDGRERQECSVSVADQDTNEESDVEIKTEPSEPASPTNTGSSAAQMHFYLLKPFTRGTSKVLRPLDRDKTVSEILRGQEVFEFPTIYALEAEPEHLPEGLLLELEYETITKEMAEEVDLELQEAGIDTSSVTVDNPPPARKHINIDRPMDETQILASLQRDARHQGSNSSV